MKIIVTPKAEWQAGLTITLATAAEQIAPGQPGKKAGGVQLLGEKQAALKELRQQVDKGWRLLWRWNSELNPNFESLWEDPEFHAIIEFLDTDMARQLESIRAMEAAEEIPLPPR